MLHTLEDVTDDACGKLCPPVLVEEAFVVMGASARPRRQGLAGATPGTVEGPRSTPAISRLGRPNPWPNPTAALCPAAGEGGGPRPSWCLARAARAARAALDSGCGQPGPGAGTGQWVTMSPDPEGTRPVLHHGPLVELPVYLQPHSLPPSA
jgi:hypothetical protein